MTVPPVTAKPETPLKEIARLMRENKVGSVLIVGDDGKLRGIVTEHDLVYACSEGWNPEASQAWEVMTENPITVTPDTEVIDIIKKMRNANVRHIPVVDKDGKPVGMVSVRDIMDFVLTLLGLTAFKELLED